MFKTEKPLVFDREGYVCIYQADGSDKYLHMLTRLNMGFIATSSFLLVMEIVSPCKYLSKLDNLINSSLFDFLLSLRMVARNLSTSDNHAKSNRNENVALLQHTNGKYYLAAQKWPLCRYRVPKCLLRKLPEITYYFVINHTDHSFHFFHPIDREKGDIRSTQLRLLKTKSHLQCRHFPPQIIR